jgi:hypothetical protein
LLQAVQTQGSRQALASMLHVPENTLLRWMSGSAQTPLQAFRKVIDQVRDRVALPGMQRGRNPWRLDCGTREGRDLPHPQKRLFKS